MLESKGEFIVKSTWDYIRHKGQPNDTYKFMWVKRLPFKISFYYVDLEVDALRKIVYELIKILVL